MIYKNEIRLTVFKDTIIIMSMCHSVKHEYMIHLTTLLTLHDYYILKTMLNKYLYIHR